MHDCAYMTCSDTHPMCSCGSHVRITHLSQGGVTEHVLYGQLTRLPTVRERLIPILLSSDRKAVWLHYVCIYVLKVVWLYYVCIYVFDWAYTLHCLWCWTVGSCVRSKEIHDLFRVSWCMTYSASLHMYMYITCIAKYTTWDQDQRKFGARYTPSQRRGAYIYLAANFRWLRLRVVY